MSLSPQFLDELRARTTLSTLINRTVKLTRCGPEFKGCCPFHNEKTASFYVNDAKAFYHCFGCGAHGDAIRWLTDRGGLQFMDAVRELAQAAGMEVPAHDPRAQAEQDRRAPLYEVMTRAAALFAAHRDAMVAARYLDTRDIGPELAARFGLGFAPDGGQFLRQNLRGTGQEVMIEAGLLIQVEGKEPYDRFRARLMFPIHDARGRVIAFGGRVIGAGEPKYLNSPDTPLFDKGRSLFNIHRAAPAARKTDRLVVVEGYMDVVGLARAGIEDVVAPNGTAVTEHQLALLWRIHAEPLMCFDGDGAGKRAMVKAALRALPGLGPDRSLRFVTLPEGKDPDDVVRKGGTEAFEALLSSSVGLAELIWTHEAAQGRLSEPEGRAGLRQRLTEHVQAIQDGNVRQQYADEFKQRFERQFAAAPAPRRDSSFSPRRGKRWKPPEQPVDTRTRAIARSGIRAQVALAIVAGCLAFPDVVTDHYEQLVRLPVDGRAREVLDVLIDAAIAGPVEDVGQLLESHGMGAAPRALRESTRLPFAFLSAEGGPEARADLVAAIIAETAL